MLVLRACLLAVLLGLAGCAGMPFGPQPRAVTLSAEQVAEALGRRIGIDKKMLDLLQVRVEKPKVTFDQQTQRLRADLEVSLSHPFSTQPLTGRAGISGGIAYDAKSLTVALLDPRIERFEIDGAPRALKDSINRLGSALGGELLQSYPLFTLKPQDLKVGGHDYEVKGFEVLSDAIKVMLTPKQ
jgi:hypothetical protein